MMAGASLAVIIRPARSIDRRLSTGGLKAYAYARNSRYPGTILDGGFAMRIQKLKTIAFVMGVTIGIVGFAGSSYAMKGEIQCKNIKKTECYTLKGERHCYTRVVEYCQFVPEGKTLDQVMNEGRMMESPKASTRSTPERAPTGGLLDSSPGFSPSGPSPTGIGPAKRGGGTIY
jgi:hypothetical protein